MTASWTTKPKVDIHSACSNCSDPEVEGLMTWAIEAVESLAYLDDLDCRAFAGRSAELLGHPNRIVNGAHVRWATGTALTALDLCAAALGRAWPSAGAYRGTREADLRSFYGSTGPKPALGALPVTAQSWVTDVCTDARYGDVLLARKPMVHGRTGRVLKVAAAGSVERDDFTLSNGATKTAQQLIEASRSLAESAVSDFLTRLAAGQLVT
jgi:hypothetical protein